MRNITYIPLENDLLIRLINRYKEDYSVAINNVIEDFLDRTAEDHGETVSFREGGYIWDQVELPPGTQLRTRYHDEWQVATVSNNLFVYNDSSYKSPSKVCNAMRGGTSNNAWITLDIKRPQDIEFKKANRFRKQ